MATHFALRLLDFLLAVRWVRKKELITQRALFLELLKIYKKQFCIAVTVGTEPKRELNIKIYLLLSQSHSLLL